MEWVVVYYSDDVQEAILRFPPGLQARYIHLTERIVTFGPNLGMPRTRSLGKGLFELRLKSPEGIARVFFCNLPGRRVMMLHAFVKKSAKTPSRELKTAQNRMREALKDADA